MTNTKSLSPSRCFRILLADIFSIARLWMTIGINEVECLIIGVYSFRMFFSAENFTCNLTSWLELLFLRYDLHLRLIFHPLLFMTRDCGNKSFDLNIHVKFQKTSETSKSFENNILSHAIQSAFEINIARNFFITVVAVTC